MTDTSVQPQADQSATEQPVASAEPVRERIPGVYYDDDLVYVDPDLRKVVGLVEWSKSGNPKSLLMKETEEEEEEESKEPATAGAVPAPAKVPAKEGKGRPMRRRIKRQRFYPWGTYRSMKRIYKIEGKIPREENQKTLDEVMEKALKEPFWD